MIDYITNNFTPYQVVDALLDKKETREVIINDFVQLSIDYKELEENYKGTFEYVAKIKNEHEKEKELWLQTEKGLFEKLKATEIQLPNLRIDDKTIDERVIKISDVSIGKIEVNHMLDSVFNMTNKLESELNSFVESSFEKAILNSNSVDELKQLRLDDVIRSRIIAENKEMYDFLWSIAEEKYNNKKREYINSLEIK